MTPAVTPPVATRDVLVRVRGLVQGVGFRPFVHQVATGLGLSGWVRNDAQGVLIRARGDDAQVAGLLDALRRHAPPAAAVSGLQVEAAPAPPGPGGGGFSILPSECAAAGSADTSLPLDLAVCADCRRELHDPRNRRHGYAFINCTQCGPRFSLVESLPYDRERTTMRAFRMCPDCAGEYHDAADRRFHAEPNACPACGPRLSLTDPEGRDVSLGDPLATAAALARAGRILAVKGVGGYHLVVDAADAGAVAWLRQRKGRDEKPLAVMFPSLADLAEAVVVPPGAAGLLASPAAPIVLLAKRPGGRLAPNLAPGNPWIGAMLPYAPLHELLLRAVGRALVVTSANASDEPLCTDNAAAHLQLARLADAFLEHDRPIAHAIDDSVVRFAPEPIVLRAARGYAPRRWPLPGALRGSWLCVGAQMKNTVGLAAGDALVLGPHVGDLAHPASLDRFAAALETLQVLGRQPATGVACDQHPGYASTAYARRHGGPVVAVQHHLAHILACLLEHGRAPEGVLGVAWDGTGHGPDGTVWGGEFLVLRAGTASRFARLAPFRLAGGEAAIRDCRRTALGLVHAHEPARFAAVAAGFGYSAAEQATLERMLAAGLQAPVTTSAGRLFDGCAALLGLQLRNSFEGQAAIALEGAATACPARAGGPSLPLRALPPGRGAAYEVDWQPLVDHLGRARSQRSAGELAGDVHVALADAIAAVARAAGLATVALSGGCFQNALLATLARRKLEQAGFEVLTHRRLPPNDGNIAAGQALAVFHQLTSVQLP